MKNGFRFWKKSSYSGFCQPSHAPSDIFLEFGLKVFKMWNFAASAGTGLAVAGLSATYYALARKSLEWERDNRIGANDQNRPRMTTSQLLLKTELDRLNSGSGHSLGLNTVTVDGDNMTSVTFPISPVSSVQSIISGLDVRNNKIMVMRSSSNGALSLDEEEEEDRWPSPSASPRNNAPNIKIIENKRVDEDHKKNTSSVSASISRLGPSPASTFLKASRETVFSTPLQRSASCISAHRLVQQPEQASEDLFAIERAKSPILYYKNPDFGKRTAARASIQLSEIRIPPNLAEKNKTSNPDTSDVDPGLALPSSSKQYRDSTRFLFPPVLSESRISVCEVDKDFQVPSSGKKKGNMTSDGSLELDDEPRHTRKEGEIAQVSNLDEIRDYNQQLNMKNPQIQKMEDSRLLSDTPPALDLKEDLENEEITDDEDVLEDSTKDSEFLEMPKGPKPKSQSCGSCKKDGKRDKHLRRKGYHSQGCSNQVPGIIDIPERSEGTPQNLDSSLEQEKKRQTQRNEAGDGDAARSGDLLDKDGEEIDENEVEDGEETHSKVSEDDDDETMFKDLMAAPSSSVLGRIPPNSWITWPARLYADFELATEERDAKAILYFLGVLILIITVLGKFFLSVGSWLPNDLDLDVEEYNPDAVMEH